jgi:hypothetical protein
MEKRLLLFVAILFLSAVAYADRCAISIIPDVSVFEPNQKAIIGWNGIDEILILSTDMHATRKTNLIEIMPFPSKPIIYEGDTSIFKRLENYLVGVRNRQLNNASAKQRVKASEWNAPRASS